MKSTKMKNKFEEQLISNGDDRLLLDKNKISNKYGCRPIPYKHLSYSSSTASTIEFDTFNYIKKYFRDNEDKINDFGWIENEYQLIRDKLRAYIGLEDNVDIALGSSGTDLELVPLVYFNPNRKIFNIVVAPDEVGGGIKNIAQAKHFSEHLTNGAKVKIGETIKGFQSYDIEYSPVLIRKDSGDFLGNDIIEKKILEEIENHYYTANIILHIVYKSKTAIVTPRESFIKHISKVYPNVLFVIDACQYRVNQATLKKFIKYNAMVLLTGSKFFGAPPFCAAVLVSPLLRERFTIEREMPYGLSDYFSRFEFPIRWKTFDKVLNKTLNIGLLLRWNAAIYEMKNFSLVNKNRFLHTVEIFNYVFKELESLMDFFEIEDIPEVDMLNKMEKSFSQTILTFSLKDESLTYEDARKLYKQLLETENMPLEYQTACHIGQPVKIKKNCHGHWRASLRISLNARFFSDYSGEVSKLQYENIKQNLSVILSKLQFLINRLSK